MSNKQFQNLRNIQTKSQIYQGFDVSQILKDAVGAHSWKTRDGFWAAVSGCCSDYAKDVYSKVSLLAQNIADIDTCNIHALKSIAKSVNAQHLTEFIIDEYPVQLENLVNLFLLF